MIVRAEKNANYSVICNVVLRDARLSWRARGIAAYLLSMPDHWAIKRDHLWKNGTEGRDAVQSAMQELEDLGYLVRTKMQDENGKWTTDLVLHEVPQAGHTVATTDDGFPVVGKPVVGKPVVGFPVAIVSTEEQVLNSNESIDPPTADQKGQQVEWKKEWVEVLVPVLYGHSKFNLLSETHWRHVHSVRAKLEDVCRPEDVRTWHDTVWKKEWPGNKGDRPRPTQVLEGIGRYVEGQAAAPSVPAGQKAEIEFDFD